MLKFFVNIKVLKNNKNKLVYLYINNKNNSICSSLQDYMLINHISYINPKKKLFTKLSKLLIKFFNLIIYKA